MDNNGSNLPIFHSHGYSEKKMKLSPLGEKIKSVIMCRGYVNSSG
jgi:hypothetical protein